MFADPADAVLSSSFSYPHRRFLWSRLRLFEDRIEFRGLGWTGLHRRTVPLDQVKVLRWWTGGDKGSVNFALTLHDGERIRLSVKSAGLWKHEVQARAENLAATDAALPEEEAGGAEEVLLEEDASPGGAGDASVRARTA